MDKQNTVTVFWTLHNPEIEPSAYLLDQLPLSWKNEILKIEGNRILNAKIYAKALLLRLMHKHRIDDYRINYSFYGKPYIEADFSFSISHSQNLVSVAATKGMVLGLDVERYQHIPLQDLNGCFVPEELNQIEKSANTAQMAIQYWCAKEAVLKADGRGLSVPMDQVVCSPELDKAVLEGQIYYLRPLNLHTNYCAYLALSTEPITLELQQIYFA